MSADYTESNIQQFLGRSHIRLRPGMYVGSTSSDALMHLLWEVLDNAVDEHLSGGGNLIKVTIAEDGGIQVDDYGRGIPVGTYGDSKRSTLAIAFEPNSGGKFDQNAYSVSGGLNGVGIAAVAALSARCDATVYRDGKITTLSFKEGDEGKFSGEGIDAPFDPTPGVVSVKDNRPAAERKERPTGTTIRFYPDYTIFDTDEVDSQKADLDIDTILKRVRNTAYLCPTLTIVVNDERFTKETYTFSFPGGVQQMLSDLMGDTPAIGESIIFEDSTSFTTKGADKNLTAAVALQWENGRRSTNTSFVNIIETPLGGTHVTGALKGIEEAVAEALTERSMLKAKDVMPELVDVMEGLHLIVNVKLPAPGYSSQTKERLKEAPVNNVVRRLVQEHMKAWFAARKNAASAREVLEKILAASRARRALNAQFDVSDVLAEVNKEAVFSAKPANLKECQKPGDVQSSLMIVEGSSALGSILSARSAEFQAVFPLKGKPLNVHSVTPESLFIPPAIASPRTPQEKRRDAQRKTFLDAGHILLQNKELDDVVKIIGAGFGDSFDVDKMRYHSVFIAADADPDGSHIAALMICFFFLHMRPMVEEGRLYLTMPPLFVTKVGKESSPEFFYTSNDAEQAALVESLSKKGKKVLDVSRRKGLGEMGVEEVSTHLLDPQTRRVKRITIESAQAAVDMLDLAMGKNADARKEWIAAPRTLALINAEGSFGTD